MTMQKRIAAVLVSIVTFLSCICICCPAADAIAFTPDFSISSKAAVLVNLDKDVIVYEKNADVKMYPASLAKIVTAMVVFDHVPASEMESTTYEAPQIVFDELYGMGASAVGLTKGEVTTVKDLLYSLLLKSACESAGILAYNVGNGSIPNFVSMMNDKALEIGCTGTHFMNPHGLHDRNQFTNAHDMAKIVKYAIDNYPELTKIACTVDYQMQPTNVHGEGWAHIYHTNSMINPDSYEYYPYVKGFKTGTLDECGRNLTTLGSKDGNNYLLVTLGSPQTDADGNTVYDHYEDHRKLYDWAFEKLEYRQIVEKGQEKGEVQVRYGENSDYVILVTGEPYSCIWNKDIDLSILKGKAEKDISKLNEDGTIDAPVRKDTKLGEYTVTINGEIITTIDLVAQQDVNLSEFNRTKSKAMNFFASGWFFAAAAISVVLIIAYIVVMLTLDSRRRKKRKVRRVRNRRDF
ncbi:MAG: D-alanyl-D-alanine carboxypeptidase [Oscillospiraceae bacterium]|nr:D-alanyl-D-alanine carboxypeptidase [Oscillospiraceae bacterium]